MYQLEEITIMQGLRRTAAKMPDRPALEFGQVTVTWKDFDTFSDRFADYFNKIGMKKGTHAAIWGLPCLEYFYAYIGLIKLGAVVIPINTHYKKRELVDALEIADVEYLVCDREQQSIIQELKHGRSHIYYERCLYLDEIPFRHASPPLCPVESDPHDMVNILFTSGTTCAIKGVMLTHHNLFNNGAVMAKGLRVSPYDKICLSVPMFHCFGVTAGLMVSIASGCALCVVRDFSMLNIINTIERHRCTIINGVPTMFLAMIYKLEKGRYDLSSLRTGIIAGSPVSPKEYMDICEHFNMNLLMAYGLTETSPCVSMSAYDEAPTQRCDNVGFATDHVTIRIADINTGEILDKNKSGEIQVKGYNVMKGYYKLVQANEEVLLKDGFIRTGDLGYIDDCDMLHITDRVKEIIIRGGESISPSEIENCIKELDNILNVKVVGIQSAVLQEEIAACVITKNGEPADGKTIREHVSQTLADYKTPKYVLTFQEFPLNATGKINLNDLKKAASNLVEASCAPTDVK